MRFLSCVLCLTISTVAFAQSPDAQQKADTIAYIKKLQDPKTGAFKVTADAPPSLRACNGAVKALHTLGVEDIPEQEKVVAFVLSCYDPKAGAFAEPGGKPDVTITSIGVMVAMELGIAKEKIAKAMAYLEMYKKGFEEERISAAAIEAWGIESIDSFQLGLMTMSARLELKNAESSKDDLGRLSGSVLAMRLRLGDKIAPKDLKEHVEIITANQRPDGGWGKLNEKTSDLDSTYRVMRAFWLMKQKPANFEKVKVFVEKCRNKDGGAGVKPGEPSTMSGVYYTTIISKWIAELEK